MRNVWVLPGMQTTMRRGAVAAQNRGRRRRLPAQARERRLEVGDVHDPPRLIRFRGALDGRRDRDDGRHSPSSSSLKLPARIFAIEAAAPTIGFLRAPVCSRISRRAACGSVRTIVVPKGPGRIAFTQQATLSGQAQTGSSSPFSSNSSRRSTRASSATRARASSPLIARRFHRAARRAARESRTFSFLNSRQALEAATAALVISGYAARYARVPLPPLLSYSCTKVSCSEVRPDAAGGLAAAPGRHSGRDGRSSPGRASTAAVLRDRVAWVVFERAGAACFLVPTIHPSGSPRPACH